MRKELKNRLKKPENIPIIIGAIIAFVGMTIPFFIMWMAKTTFNVSSFEKLGTVGDFFGGTTVGLLSLASMLFVIAAIVMQKDELKLQREELQYTRAELEKTREEHAMTNKTMKLQQFETTFFNLINLHKDTLQESIYTNIYNTEKYNGREALKIHFECINRKFENEIVEVFLLDYLANDRNDSEKRFTAIAEIIYGLIYCDYKNPSYFNFHFPIPLMPLDVFTKEISKDFIDTSDEHKRSFIRRLNKKDLENISNHLNDNHLLIEFSNKYLEDNYYKEEALKKAINDENFELYNYTKIVTLIFSLIAGNDSINNEMTNEEKHRYALILVSQLTTLEITLLNYYAKLAGKDELDKYLNKFSVVSLENKLENSIV